MASVEVDSHKDIPQFRQARSMNQKLARGLGANTHIVSSASIGHLCVPSGWETIQCNERLVIVVVVFLPHSKFVQFSPHSLQPLRNPLVRVFFGLARPVPFPILLF